jgi:tRNA 2-selenouridine synthase
MAVQHIPITEFLDLAQKFPMLDVRSPGEYNHAHIPGAFSLPLFSDEERKIIGTSYKQQGKQKAIKIGLDYFGPKMRPMVDQVEQEVVTRWLEKHDLNKHDENSKTVLVHCWRGGMRSGAVAWLLDFYGFNVLVLEGGYKSYRNWVLWQFSKDYQVKVIGGYTGSGKTSVVRDMQRHGHRFIDLEEIANHKGSAFGGIGMPEQPKQEMFENLLAEKLCRLRDVEFWIEDESQRIGSLNIPPAFWETIRKSPVYFIDIPFEERLNHIVQEYGKLEREKLVNAILRIQKRLGPLETKTAIGWMVEDNIVECFRILLKYYDKTYEKSLANRENLQQLLNKIPASNVDTISNSEKISSCAMLLSSSSS